MILLTTVCLGTDAKIVRLYKTDDDMLALDIEYKDKAHDLYQTADDNLILTTSNVSSNELPKLIKIVD
jgi:hypothetical protein